MPKIPKKVKKETVIETVATEEIAPIESPVEIVEEVKSGGCTDCNGTGRRNGEDLCIKCQGRGVSL